MAFLFNNFLINCWSIVLISLTGISVPLYSFNRFSINNVQQKSIQEAKSQYVPPTRQRYAPLLITKEAEKKRNFPLKEKKLSNSIVRVLLAYTEKNYEWQIASNNGFLLYENPHKNPLFIAKKSVTIAHKKNRLCINGKQSITNWMLIKPVKEHFNFDNANYNGSLLVIMHAEKIYIINYVKLEEYVFSVLKTESWPGWPLEVNKVFAITSRTYALCMMNEARKKKRFYDLKNSNAHQTYKGIHNCAVIKKAVEQTKGMILIYNNIPILAMFDCCCGGIIPAYIEDFNFLKAPYLARTYACSFCKKSKIYSWKITYTLDEFSSRLAKMIAPHKKIENVTIIKKDKAGLITQVAIKTSQGEIRITGKELYSCLKEVKSFHYTVKKTRKELEFTGKGYGHHIGLCQWGAREMVRDGYTYKKIVQFYYPGTQLALLTQLKL